MRECHSRASNLTKRVGVSPEHDIELISRVTRERCAFRLVLLQVKYWHLDARNYLPEIDRPIGISRVSPALNRTTSTKLLDRFTLEAKKLQRSISFRKFGNRSTMTTRSGAGKKAPAKATSKKTSNNTRRGNSGKTAAKKGVSTKNDGNISENPYKKKPSTLPQSTAKENRKSMKSLSLFLSTQCHYLVLINAVFC